MVRDIKKSQRKWIKLLILLQNYKRFYTIQWLTQTLHETVNKPTLFSGGLKGQKWEDLLSFETFATFQLILTMPPLIHA